MFNFKYYERNLELLEEAESTMYCSEEAINAYNDLYSHVEECLDALRFTHNRKLKNLKWYDNFVNKLLDVAYMMINLSDNAEQDEDAEDYLYSVDYGLRYLAREVNNLYNFE